MAVIVLLPERNHGEILITAFVRSGGGRGWPFTGTRSACRTLANDKYAPISAFSVLLVELGGQVKDVV